eukprot:4641930-Karenia_brevis.AAC.1
MEKCNRYDASVTPLALETYGRMGVASMSGLRRFSSTVSAHAVKSGFLRQPRGLLAALRLDIERTLLWNIADTALQSLGRWQAG